MKIYTPAASKWEKQQSTFGNPVKLTLSDVWNNDMMNQPLSSRPSVEWCSADLLDSVIE